MKYSKDESLVIVALRRLDLLSDRVEALEDRLDLLEDGFLALAEEVRLLNGHRYISDAGITSLNLRIDRYLTSTIGWMRTHDTPSAIKSLFNIKERKVKKNEGSRGFHGGENVSGTNLFK